MKKLWLITISILIGFILSQPFMGKGLQAINNTLSDVRTSLVGDKLPPTKDKKKK